MTILFVILVILCCVILGFVVLVQNPKGGGLAASIGGLNTQFMGVKQTTDVLEKGTWIFAGLVALLCLFSAAFIPKQVSSGGGLMEKVNTKPATTSPGPNAAPFGNQPPAGNQQPAGNQPPASNQQPAGSQR